MAKFIVILLIGLTFEAAGVVILSSGLKQIGEPERVSASEIARMIKKGVTNQRILFGVFLEAIFFGILLYLLSQNDASLVWPLTSLGFVITALGAKFILNEQVTPMRWGGICLIVAGAMLVSFSEKLKGTPPPVAGEAPVTPPK